MEELLKQLLEGQKQLFEGQAQILRRLDSLEQRFDALEQRFDSLEGPVQENSEFIRALIHRTEELDAKYDALLNTTATNEIVGQIAEDIKTVLATQTIQGESINILALRQLKTEAELATLKKAQ